MLDIKTNGPFNTFEELQNDLHRVYIQIHNETWSHFHRPEDEALLKKLFEHVSYADTMLAVILDNEFDVRKLKENK